VCGSFDQIKSPIHTIVAIFIQIKSNVADVKKRLRTIAGNAMFVAGFTEENGRIKFG